ncbi:MAG: 4-hydroxy-tetrahydrodipicolinate reductase [Ruminococcaceae bacterium]|nr:4-hydroxy-tetrahydrodipicolinate reductase [Oscillospiraceae bacterium]
MKAVIVGYGRMGRMIEEAAEAAGFDILAIVDIDNLNDLDALQERANVVFDFSAPAALDVVYDYIKRTGSPYLCGCTGHSPEEKEKVRSLSAYAPVIHAANYSLGVAVVKKALELISPVLRGSFDVEVLESHHNRKVDAPSGTAILLADAVDPAHEYRRVYERHSVTAPRGEKEIGMVSRRGGNLAGEHVVAFYGEDETIELTHRATSRRIFVTGAVKAALILKDKPNGFYTIEDLLF